MSSEESEASSSTRDSDSAADDSDDEAEEEERPDLTMGQLIERARVAGLTAEKVSLPPPPSRHIGSK